MIHASDWLYLLEVVVRGTGQAVIYAAAAIWITDRICDTYMKAKQ
jgi:hypothetical protein